MRSVNWVSIPIPPSPIVSDRCESSVDSNPKAAKNNKPVIDQFSLAVEAVGSLLVCFGVFDVESRQYEIRVLDLTTMEWTFPEIDYQPIFWHTMFTVTSEKISSYIYYIRSLSLSEESSVLALDVSTIPWEMKSLRHTTPSKLTVCFATAAVDELIFKFGGYSWPANSNSTLDVFDTIHNEWNKIEPSNSPPPGRHSHAMCSVGKKLLVVGGQREEGETQIFLNDIWCYDILSNSWISIFPTTVFDHIGYSSISFSAFGLEKSFAVVFRQANNNIRMYELDVASFDWLEMKVEGDTTIKADRGNCIYLSPGQWLLDSGSKDGDLRHRSQLDIRFLEISQNPSTRKAGTSSNIRRQKIKTTLQKLRSPPSVEPPSTELNVKTPSEIQPPPWADEALSGLVIGRSPDSPIYSGVCSSLTPSMVKFLRNEESIAPPETRNVLRRALIDGVSVIQNNPHRKPKQDALAELLLKYQDRVF
eukprot:GHVP01041620.1.p1 GENE.GHVP01041620.1~~GHVP01041620.1.p1  ORF type:complete len:475 (-),score=61.69 GHVP01041620.1:235-1659(-)